MRDLSAVLLCKLFLLLWSETTIYCAILWKDLAVLRLVNIVHGYFPISEVTVHRKDLSRLIVCEVLI